MKHRIFKTILLLVLFALIVANVVLTVGLSQAAEIREVAFEEDPIELTEFRIIFENSPEDVKPETEEVTESPFEYIDLGEFMITAYCACEKCCEQWALNRPNGVVYGASGIELIPYRSIAVDPSVIPLGATVCIDGEEYFAHDTGGAIKGNRIDVYFPTHEEALKWGIRHYDVVLIKG